MSDPTEAETTPGLSPEGDVAAAPEELGPTAPADTAIVTPTQTATEPAADPIVPVEPGSPTATSPALVEPAAPAVPAEPAKQRRRIGMIVTVCLLSLLLAGALALAGYLWHAAGAWRQDSAAWEAQARANGETVAELHTQLTATSWELDGARSQLATATARITELADEKAQMGDANAVTEQYLDFQRRVTEAAGTVAQAMARCIDGQSQLIGFERNSERYDPDDLQRFADQVSALCVQARDANDLLQAELDR